LGVYVSLVQKNNHGADDEYLKAECDRLKNARPTAMNLFWGVDRVRDAALKVRLARPV
jgi:methylthioribose-1-phosphate isomerase